MVLFSLLIAVYLMNLLIGLLNMHIKRDRASYFIQKAEVFIKYHKYLFLDVQIINIYY